MPSIDDKDRRILKAIQNDAKLSYKAIGEEVGMAASATLERVRKLEDRGAILGRHTLVDPKSIDLGLTAFILVTANLVNYSDRLAQHICKHPNILEVYEVAGEASYLVKACVKDSEALSDLLHSHFSQIDEVKLTNTILALKTIKSTPVLPI